MSITGLTVEALPAVTGSASFGDVRVRMDALLGELTTLTLAGVADPLDAARWARAVESRVSAFRLAALAEAERAGAARKVGALGTAAWL